MSVFAVNTRERERMFDPTILIGNTIGGIGRDLEVINCLYVHLCETVYAFCKLERETK